jgi:tritrans,polycis-undecaprenyl-diphosphate synthase [geranylgeranyl-diphosphate specific]
MTIMSKEKAMPEKIKLDIPKEKIPKHVAVILDGNRRLARRMGLDPWKGHELGEKKVEKLLEWCYQLDINELTLYAFSMQNFNRSKLEYDFLIDLFEDAFKTLLKDKRVIEQDVKIIFLGRINLFPEKIQKLMHEIMEKTKNNKAYILNMAMAYGGREEITDALKKVIHDIKSGKLNETQIDDKTLSNYLYTKSEPDLIIRTSGEIRTSNFMPWQGIYSEWIFLKKCWPEFELEDLIECVKEYSMRDIRKGK